MFWLVVFDGAEEVANRMFALKRSILLEHQHASARAREAKEAARLERASGGSRDSLASLGARNDGGTRHAGGNGNGNGNGNHHADPRGPRSRLNDSRTRSRV